MQEVLAPRQPIKWHKKLRKPCGEHKKIRRTGEPAAGCKEGKETEREEIVSPPQRMDLAYPENLKSILIFYK